MNNLRNETGSSLLFIIITIIVLGVLGTGMLSLFTSSTVSVFTPNYSLKARYMAEAGIRYAKGEMRNATDLAAAVSTLNNNGNDYVPEDGSGFTLNISGNSSPYTIVSTGFSGTGAAASYIELSDTFAFEDGSGSGGKDFEFVVSGGSGTSIHGAASVEGGISTANDFSIHGSGILKGDVNAGGDVTVNGSGKVAGDIVSGGDIDVRGSGNITGNIDAQGDVSLTGDALVVGDITAKGDVVISGSSRVLGTINAGGSVIISGSGSVGGNIVAGGDVTLKGGSVGGNVDSGGSISLHWGCSIGGNATAADSIDYKSSEDIVGSILKHTASPPRLLPQDPEEYYEPAIQFPDILFTAGGTDICGTGTPLAPGKYGVLETIWSCKKIYLKPGKYYFEEIDAKAWSSALYLDLSDATEEKGIEIFVVGNANFGSDFKVMVSTDGINYEDSATVDNSLAAHLYLETRGEFNMGSGGQWFGAVYSWDKLSISSGHSSYIGSFYLRDLTKLDINSDINIILIPSNYIRNNW
ncbi:polymer-forming cytoskeletal protein [Desulfobacula phenolica]|uniref:Protein CcmA, bactofilin family n=1 Tax=Desulfobacula phenolica TaxID=90732 RepID=A0A1H2FSM7_9BACT|nr:polymer-forming cytoskeletal protein [Desulfobacula phenolica]SDU10357.1 protein CcmA, bactofilin family [Desulfobacula phenolica]